MPEYGVRIAPEFLKQQLYVNARAFFPNCTFREFYAPDYAEYIVSVFYNGKYLCCVLWDMWSYPSGPVVQTDVKNYGTVMGITWFDLGKVFKRIKDDN